MSKLRFKLVRQRILHIASLCSLVLLYSCTKEPLIHSISPRIGNLGELLTIRGEHFGTERNENFVSIAGITPTASSYHTWTDTEIIVRLPDFGESGLVYVFVNKQKSNPALFTNKQGMPELTVQKNNSSMPEILSIEPAITRIGTILTINGRNFGHSKSQGAVYFTWEAETPPATPLSLQTPLQLEAGNDEFTYEAWSDREIKVRVPDGASAGSVAVQVGTQRSAPQYLNIRDMPGTKVFRDKRSYAFSYSVNVKDIIANGPNSLFLWLPQPATSAAQKTPQIVQRSAEPFIPDYQGLSLYQLQNLKPGETRTISISLVVDVYAVETKIRAQSIKQDNSHPGGGTLVRASPLLPSNNEQLREIAKEIAGRERNRYNLARRVYNWIHKEILIQTETEIPDVLSALESRQADPYTASLLFVSLCRALDIPSIPIAGYIIDVNRQYRAHWWAEFWIDGFGWVPVDPSAASLAGTAPWPERKDATEYYFGNMDSHRIAFSRGIAQISPLDPQGRIRTTERSWSLQTIREEATGALESYTSLWSDLAITGVY
jgi:transglutaminase-like putative cysteine protease